METRLRITDAIKAASEDPCAFFAGDPDGILKHWKIATHPDKWPGEEDAAKDWFTRFTELHAQAINPREVGGYRIKRKLPDGDLCEILIGSDESGEVLIKKPLVKATSVMKGELSNLKKIVESANDQAKHLFPAFIETAEDASVFRFDSKLETAASLSARYPEGVGGRHIGWIFKRVLLALSWAHGADVVHGAVTPEHILISKSNHGIVLCDWIHSGAPGSPIKIVPKKYKDAYPAFAVAEKRLQPELDIVMAAAIAKQLAGSTECPAKIANYLHAISNISNVRGASAWDLHQEFDNVLRRVYGQPKFVELV